VDNLYINGLNYIYEASDARGYDIFKITKRNDQKDMYVNIKHVEIRNFVFTEHTFFPIVT